LFQNFIAITKIIMTKNKLLHKEFKVILTLYVCVCVFVCIFII